MIFYDIDYITFESQLFGERKRDFMANQRDKTSIFLTIFIGFLILAMGIYGFIYRDKIGEYIQKITKKSENVERHTVKTSSEKSQNADRDKEIVRLDNREKPIPEKTSPIDSGMKENVPVLPIDREENSRKEERVLGKEKKSKTPQLSEPEHDYFDRKDIPAEKGNLEFKDNLPGEEKPFIASHLKSEKGKGKGKKRKSYKKSKMKKRSSLERRVARLEKKLKAFSPKNKKKNLEKRVYRLEKIVSKKK